MPELNLSGKTHYRRTHVNASSFSSFEGGDSSGGGGSHRALLYKDKEVEVPRSAKLVDGVMLGAHTKVKATVVVMMRCAGTQSAGHLYFISLWSMSSHLLHLSNPLPPCAVGRILRGARVDHWRQLCARR